MEDPVLLEWIDQYLMGNIRDEDKAELERMMASDPEIANLVEESRKAFSVLQAARNRHLREKLKAFDSHDSRRSGFLPKWFILSASILVIFGGSWCWASYYFSNKAIAIRYYKMAHQPGEELAMSDEMKSILKEAANAFNKQEYGRASNLYNSILENAVRTVPYNVRWSLLMSDLALHGQTSGWEQALETFANEAPAPYGQKAQELSRLLQAPWYRIIVSLTQADISGLKPRLI